MKKKIMILSLCTLGLFALVAFIFNSEVTKDPLALSPVVGKRISTPTGTLISCDLKALKDTVDIPPAAGHRSGSQTGGAGAGCCGCPAAPAWRTAPPDRRPPWCGRRQNRRCARSQGSPVPLQGRKNRSRTAPARPECGRAASCSCCAAGPRPGHRTAWRCRCPPGQSSWPAAQRLRRVTLIPS